MYTKNEKNKSQWNIDINNKSEKSIHKIWLKRKIFNFIVLYMTIMENVSLQLDLM